MKTYSNEELKDALSKVPKPLRDFAVSPTLLQIYDGLEKKHKLTGREMITVSDIVHATLLGLETESALETNVHQALPHLSHATTVELVADIGSRILKESKRRVAEQILEPSPYTAALGYTPPSDPETERIESINEETPEWDVVIGKKLAEDATERKLFEEEYAKKQKESSGPHREEYDNAAAYDETGLDDDTDIKSRYELEEEEIEREFAEKQAALGGAPVPSPLTIEATVGGASASATVTPVGPTAAASQEPGPSIAVQKLTAPSTTQKQETTSELATPKTTPPPVQTPIYKGTDPYRESVE